MIKSNNTTTSFCPICVKSTSSNVKDSRPTKYSGHEVIRRRRTCEECGGKFTTLELPASLLDDTKLRAEILKRVFDLVYVEMMEGADNVGNRFKPTEGDF